MARVSLEPGVPSAQFSMRNWRKGFDDFLRPHNRQLASGLCAVRNCRVVSCQQSRGVTHSFDQALSPIGLLDSDSDFPSHGVPRPLDAEVCDALLLRLLLSQGAIESAAEKAVEFLLVLSEIRHVSVPALAVFQFAGSVWMNGGPAGRCEHGKAFAECANPVGQGSHAFRLLGDQRRTRFRRTSRAVADVMELMRYRVFKLFPADVRVEIQEDRRVGLYFEDKRVGQRLDDRIDGRMNMRVRR